MLYDAGAHFGSLLALLLYFRKDLARMSAGWVASFSAGRNRDGDLVWFLVIATVPICLAGLLFHHTAERLRDPLVIAGATVLFGLLLWWADHFGRRERDLGALGFRDAVVIGLFQALAMSPRHVTFGHHDHRRVDAGPEPESRRPVFIPAGNPHYPDCFRL